jgi:deazaflavin-dependent oxidoreductase (nitroreductase family)
MVLPKSVAAFNRKVTNRITGPVANRLPGFGVIRHTGRKSGRGYRTPVNVFAVPDGYVVALTYGAGTDWVRNVRAAGGCDLETRGHVEHLVSPEVVHDPAHRAVNWPTRQVLRLIGADDFLRLAKPTG